MKEFDILDRTASLNACTAQGNDGGFCDAPSFADMPFAICADHAMRLYHHMVDLSPEALAILSDTRLRKRSGRTTAAERRDRHDAIKVLTAGRTILYGVQLADGVVKIGYTTKFNQRLTGYGPDAEVLGFTTGTFEAEQAIHRRLAAHIHHGREYYHPVQAVFDVINAWRVPMQLEPLAA